MNDEVEQATEWLEKITGDPLADAVRGTVRVISASAPNGRARYQECRLELEAEGPGVERHTVQTAVVFPIKVWPRVGDILSARVSPTHPDAVDVDWQALSRR